MSQDTIQDRTERIKLMEEFSTSMIAFLKSLADYSSSIPGFVANINTHDRMLLVKYAFFECWMIHTSKINTFQDDTIQMCGGSSVTKQQLATIFDVSMK